MHIHTHIKKKLHWKNVCTKKLLVLKNLFWKIAWLDKTTCIEKFLVLKNHLTWKLACIKNFLCQINTCISILHTFEDKFACKKLICV
jgi:uncharacterized protein (DUF486 family)